MRVENLMTKDVSVCHPSTTLNDAASLMWDHDCGSLPVVPDDDGDEVVGMITDRDICMSAYLQGKGLKDLRVRDAMSHQVVSCTPEDDVHAAESLMRRAQVRRLPVVDRQGHLAGILSLAQLARAATDGTEEVEPAEIGETLASICEPTSGSRSPV